MQSPIEVSLRLLCSLSLAPPFFSSSSKSPSTSSSSFFLLLEFDALISNWTLWRQLRLRDAHTTVIVVADLHLIIPLLRFYLTVFFRMAFWLVHVQSNAIFTRGIRMCVSQHVSRHRCGQVNQNLKLNSAKSSEQKLGTYASTHHNSWKLR